MTEVRISQRQRSPNSLGPVMIPAKPPKGFEGQFLLSADPVHLTSATDRGATVTKLNSLYVACFERLAHRRAFDEDGRTVGLLLGDPLDTDGEHLVRDSLTLSSRSDDVDGSLEDQLYQLAGRYVFVLDYEDRQRIYLDAGASMPVVYDPETRLAASSTGLLLGAQAYRERLSSGLYEHLHIRRSGWFPAGLTAHRGIRRLLANHYLDLGPMSTIRHWPREAITRTTDPDAACRQIITSTRSTIQACLESGPVGMSLTAGHDSRLVMALARDVIDNIETFTIIGDSDYRARLDCLRARELAERFSLRHSCLPAVNATPAQAEDWHARSGHCVGGSLMRIHPTFSNLSGLSFYLGGMGGEIGRGSFWRRADTATTVIDAERLSGRFGMPRHDEVVRAVDAWLSGVPAWADSFLLLDLADIELKLGPWAFAQPPGTSPTRHLDPLISRVNFTAMLSSPPEWRSTNRMILRIMELAWPELLELPINRYGDWRDSIMMLERALRHPHLVAKRLRKQFGWAHVSQLVGSRGRSWS